MKHKIVRWLTMGIASLAILSSFVIPNGIQVLAGTTIIRPIGNNISDGSDSSYEQIDHTYSGTFSRMYPVSNNISLYGITNVEFFIREESNYTFTFHLTANISGTFQDLLNNSGGSLSTYSVSEATNPTTGLQWTLTDINSMQIGFSITPASSFGTGEVYDIWAVVTWGGEPLSVVTMSYNSTSNSTANLTGDVTGIGINGLYVYKGIAWQQYTGTIPANGMYTNNPNHTGSFTDKGINGYFSESATGLTIGNDYIYQAQIFDGSWAYGLPNIFTFRGTGYAPVVTSDGENYADLSFPMFSSTITDSGNSTITSRTIQLGTSSGVYNIPITSGLNPGGIGVYPTLGPALSANTTYYWRAKVTAIGGDLQPRIGYGNERSFTTGVLTTTPVSINVSTDGFVATADSLTFTGSVLSSGHPLVSAGIYYSENITDLNQNDLSRASKIQATINGFGIFLGQFSVGTPHILKPDTNYYFMAYAIDGGSTSSAFGQVKTAHTLSVTPASVTIRTDGYTIQGSIVTIKAHENSNVIDALQINHVGFNWGTDNTALSGNDSGEWSAEANSSSNTVLPDFSFQIPNLLPNTTYYFRAKIFLNGSWLVSNLPAESFTTGTNTITGICDVVTLPVTSATSTSFIGNMQIVAINSGVASQIGFYVSYFSDGRNSTKLPIGVLTGYNVGTYSGTVAGLNKDTKVWYAGYAINPSGEAQGVFLPVQLSPSGVNPNPTSGITSDFSDILRAQMRTLNLDNPTGHWVYMFLWMMFPSIIFGIMIIILISKKENLLARIVGFIWLIIIMIILGTFAWSGLLGWILILILVCVAVAGIGLLASIFISKGSVTE